MIDSLYIGATGMHAQQLNVNAISNNISNINTAGFKKSRVSFEDLLYRNQLTARGYLTGDSASNRIGVGAGVSSVSKIFSDGELKKTDSPLDFAIRGPGFFEVTRPDGSSAYTRSGTFVVNRDGLLSTPDGFALRPTVVIPPDATEVIVNVAGRVTAKVPTDNQPIDIGQIDLVQFVNPSGLNPIGDNLYLPTEKSGDGIIGRPGENGLGGVVQGFLESSNVKLIDELINLIVAQRAYEANSKAVQASDEILSINNNLRR